MIFIVPNTVSPFYRNVRRIPRKLKKRIKSVVSFKYLTKEQILWEYLGYHNKEYKQFLIDKVIS